MPKKVFCSLPNASNKINGVSFEPTEEGVISVDLLEDDVAAQFAGIPGYILIDAEPAEPAKPSKTSKKAPAAGGDGGDGGDGGGGGEPPAPKE